MADDGRPDPYLSRRAFLRGASAGLAAGGQTRGRATQERAPAEVGVWSAVVRHGVLPWPVPLSRCARLETPPHLALELREVAADHRQIERLEDRFHRLALEQELEGESYQ